MNILAKFKSIKTFVFDVDGVLTDGTLLILQDGQQARQMNIKDGYALQLAVKKGYRVVVISGGIINVFDPALATFTEIGSGYYASSGSQMSWKY